MAQLKTTLYPINFVKQSLQGVGILGGALALILGALAVGSEFGWGTVKTVSTNYRWLRLRASPRCAEAKSSNLSCARPNWD